MSSGKGLLCYKGHSAHVRTTILVTTITNKYNWRIGVILPSMNKVISGPGSVICKLVYATYSFKFVMIQHPAKESNKYELL